MWASKGISRVTAKNFRPPASSQGGMMEEKTPDHRPASLARHAGRD
jgi:hypothetical protein